MTTPPWGYPNGPVTIGAPVDRDADPRFDVVDTGRAQGDLEVSTQIAVIGSGAGGAVVAAELARRGLRVVIVEQGRRFERKDFHDSALTTFLEMYEGGGSTVALGRPAIALPYGRAVGGSTIVNSGTCFRIPDRVADKWSDLGLTELGGDGLADEYKRIEARLRVAEVSADVAGENTDVVRRGVEALGLSGGYLGRNAHGCAGSGRCVFGCPSGAKQSMERTFLPDAVAAGARIYADCEVERILLNGGRAAGLVAKTGSSRTLTVRADHVVVAAGAIGTPQLLLQNRLGGAEVGRHLHLHPAGKVVAELDEAVGGRGVPQSYYVDELHDDGVMLEGAWVPPEFAALALPWFGRAHAGLMNRAEQFATFGMMVTDTSEGRVHRKIAGAPMITYRLNQRDTDAFKQGILLCARIFFAAGAKAVYCGIPGLDRLAQDELTRLERFELRPEHLELAAFHPMGTCRLGHDPRQSVVRPDFRVHGVERLWIADASVIPTSLGVNPQLTIMALAARAAGHIASEFESG